MPMVPVLSLLLVIIATSATMIQAMCSYRRDDYEASWVVGMDQLVHFKLNATAPANQSNWWTAIGFGEGHNAGLDIIMVIVENNKATLMDRRSVSYAGSVRTDWQHTVNENVRLENGRVFASFSRPLMTNEVQDNPLTSCMPWAFPYSGGITRGSQMVVQHTNIPDRFHICDIAKNCRAEQIAQQTTTVTDSELQEIQAEIESKMPDDRVMVTPEQCSFAKNDYSIHWFEENGNVFFDLTTKAPNNTNNWWTAVGFGDGHIAGLDVLMVIVENGTTRILDRKSVSYAGSVVDDHQDVTVFGTTLSDGTLHAQFSRPLVSNDPQDNPIDECEVWAFPYSGGPNNGNWRVTQHFEIPERRRICDVAINCKRSPTDNSFNILIPSPLAAQWNGANSHQYGFFVSCRFFLSLSMISLLFTKSY